MPATFLDTPIEYLKGIGPQRAEVLKKELGIFLFRDLLTHYPYRYVDRTKFQTIKEINDDYPYVQLRGVIESLTTVGAKRGQRLVAVFRDNTGTIELVWFQGHKWMADKLKTQTEYIVFGKPTEFNRRYNLAHPEIELASTADMSLKSAFQSVYSSTEKLKSKGFDSEGIRRLQKQLISQINSTSVEENLSIELLSDFKLLPKWEAMKQIHFPDSNILLQKAEYRLKFEELFFIQLKLLRLHHINVKTVPGAVFSKGTTCY